jgi:hypothetical protein
LERGAALCIAIEMEADMNPMMIPFVIYHRWLELFVFPFLNHMEAASNSAMSQAKEVQAEVIDLTKKQTESLPV